MQRGSIFTACAGLVCAGAFSLGAASPGPAVAVTGGRVAGRALHGGAVFMGIPFAQPPVGDLRWREPMPVKAWTGVRDATQYGAPCAQVAAGWNDKVAALGSEDCLFLNVWAPQWPSRSRRPVMFWIHGGANMGGSAMGAAGIEPPFDGEKLAQHGVVVVTINYRLGMFGFFVHPELTAESPHHAAGNYGVLDQIAALKWVKDNIAKFGGDPGNVTIFGQSAGAHDVGLLMTSPLAKGLFVHAIGESGSVIIRGELTPTRASKEQAGVKLAEAMKAPASGALKYMRGLPAADVLKVSPSYGGGGALRPEPDIDGWAITRPPAEVFRAGEESPVPLIIGNNGRERSVAGGPDGLKKAIENFYGSAAPQALKLYSEMGATYPPHGDAGSHFATDTTFRCSAVTVVGWHSARYPTYEFEFTRGYEPRGAVHSWELQYVFGMLSPQASEEGDRKLSAQMQEYWTNFAKTGNPNGGALPVWPKADSSKRGYLDFSAEGPVAKTALRGNACELFAEKVKAQMGHSN